MRSFLFVAIVLCLPACLPALALAGPSSFDPTAIHKAGAQSAEGPLVLTTGGLTVPAGSTLGVSGGAGIGWPAIGHIDLVPKAGKDLNLNVSGAGSVVVSDGQKVCLDGAACTKYLDKNGGTISSVPTALSDGYSSLLASFVSHASMGQVRWGCWTSTASGYNSDGVSVYEGSQHTSLVTTGIAAYVGAWEMGRNANVASYYAGTAGCSHTSMKGIYLRGGSGANAGAGAWPNGHPIGVLGNGTKGGITMRATFSNEVGGIGGDPCTAIGLPNASTRLFVGLRGISDGTLAIIDPATEPSTWLDTVYVGADAGDTNLKVCSNDGTASATCTDLGASFPKRTRDLYEVTIFTVNGGSHIYVNVRSEGGATATVDVTSDLPRNDKAYTWTTWAGSGNVGGVEIALRLGGVCWAAR